MGKASVEDNEKILEMDGGNECTTMYLMPQNCTLKMLKIVNFMYSLPQ